MKENKCPHNAVFRYTWAGQDEALCCVLHGQALKTVANAMAYNLQLILIGGINQCSHPDDLPDSKESE